MQESDPSINVTMTVPMTDIPAPIDSSSRLPLSARIALGVSMWMVAFVVAAICVYVQCRRRRRRTGDIEVINDQFNNVNVSIRIRE